MFATPWFGRMITLLFVNEWLSPIVKVNATVPKLCAPSCNCNVAVKVLPGTPLTTKLNGRETVAPFATSAPYDRGALGLETPSPDNNVATRLPVLAVPTLRRPKLNVTVSPESSELFAGGGVSAVSAAPEATMSGASGFTANVTFVVLLAEAGSVDPDVTVKRLLELPVLDALAVISTVALPFAGRLPRSLVTAPSAFTEVPCEFVTETKLRAEARTLLS